MAVVAILNPKGGSGKTTLATNLARALHDCGCRVLIVDSDPQGSARDWHAADRENPVPLVALDRAGSLKTLASMAESYDFIVIDGGAKLESMLAAAIKASDVVLIPVQPSPYDIWATADLVEAIQARQEIADGTPRAAFVITRKIAGTKLGSDVRSALGEHGLPILAAEVVQRQVYPRTAAAGLTVFDADNAQARDEIDAVATELQTLAAGDRR